MLSSPCSDNPRGQILSYDVSYCCYFLNGSSVSRLLNLNRYSPLILCVRGKWRFWCELNTIIQRDEHTLGLKMKLVYRYVSPSRLISFSFVGYGVWFTIRFPGFWLQILAAEACVTAVGRLIPSRII